MKERKKQGNKEGERKKEGNNESKTEARQKYCISWTQEGKKEEKYWRKKESW